MRTIQKTISLEPMTSRMPSVMPAYKDNVLYYFDDDSLKERDYKLSSNYGMIPLNLRLSGVTFVNGVLSAENGWDKVALHSSQCFCEEENEFTRQCNAMIPKELDCEYTDKDIEKHKQYNDLCDFTISFERLSNWYYFFKEYYHLLNDYGHCNRTYSSATEYYYYESGERYADQMLYGTDEQIYIDLDKEFADKGGIVDVEKIGISGATDIGFYWWICENIVPSYYISKDYVEYWKRGKLYYPDVIRWIAWFTERSLYETEETYTATTYDENDEIIEREHWNCKQEDFDCCECEEFFNRGGKRELKRMLDWYNALQDNITKMNDAIKENIECFIPTMDDKIELQNSLEDLGQYTIFSREYELGIDYRTASYGDTENTHGGTVVEISGDTKILKDEKTGFKYNEIYMEKEYDEDAWDDYTQKYMSENRGEFVADGYQYYAYDNDNVMYTGDEEADVIEKFNNAYTYEITPTDAILIDGVLYDIQHSEFGIYDTTNKYIGGKKFFVYREKDTSTPYTLVNGKKVYAEWYANPNPDFDNKPCYYFTFFKVDNKTKGEICGVADKSFNITNYKPFGRKESTKEEDVIDYITYEGEIYEVTGNSICIQEDEEDCIERPRVFGYAYDKNNNLMYIIKNEDEEEIVVDDKKLEEVPKSSIEDDTIIIGLDYEPIIYKAKELSGQAMSHLTDLESTDVLIDDIGNKIDGRYNPNVFIFEGENGYDASNAKFALIVNGDYVLIYNTEEERTNAERNLPAGSTYEETKCNVIFNHQPPQGSELELLYDVGNTSNIRRFKLTAQEISEVEDDINYFAGNIITEMIFYYKDIGGNVVDDTKVSVVLTNNDTYKITIKGKNIDTAVTTNSSTSLSAITASMEARTEIEESEDETIMFDGEDIYCDVTYYIGATLSRKKGEPFRLAYAKDNHYNYGVEYKETVKFVKENREYYLKKIVGKQIPTTFNSPDAHSVSYPVYVYKLVQEMTDIDADVYGTYFQAPIAKFKTEVNLIKDDLTSNYSGYRDMDEYNNIHVSPTFKQEYMLGLSSLENIDSDIYIERGINAAFEKHLKLGEVATLEALEQFGNGYFKIIQS